MAELKTKPTELSVDRMRRRRAHAFVLAGLLLAGSGCGQRERPDSPAGDAAAEQTSAAELPDREEFVTNGLRDYGTSRATFAANLGTPDSMSADVVANRHVPDVQDTLFTIHYPGLIAHVHRPGPGGELLSAVEVTHDRHLRYAVIGLPRQAIERAFGPPDEATDSTATYYCRSCIADNDPVQLLFAGDGVRRVTFNFYVD